MLVERVLVGKVLSSLYRVLDLVIKNSTFFGMSFGLFNMWDRMFFFREFSEM